MQGIYNPSSICKDHNLKFEYISKDQSDPSKKFACRICIDQQCGVKTIEQLMQKNQRIKQQYNTQCTNNLQTLNLLLHNILFIREDFLKTIEAIISEIRIQIQSTQIKIEEMKKILKMMQDEIKIQHDKYLEQQRSMQTSTKKLIENLQQSFGLDKLIDQLNKIDLNGLDYDEQDYIKIDEAQIPNDILSNNKTIIKYEYQLLPQSQIKQEKKCYAIAFNRDNSQIITGCGNDIKVFDFKYQQMRQIQQIQSHQNDVSCLLFMKNSNQFISGSMDNTIKIWQYNNNKKWTIVQTLNQHKEQISCLIVNQKDDLIISGSDDKNIIFWRLKNDQWNFDQMIECSGEVNTMSLNDSCNKLVISDQSQYLHIFEQKDQYWIIYQKIKIQNLGYRLCFISDVEFVFLSLKDLSFYSQNQQNNNFSKTYEVELNVVGIEFPLFPIQFIKSKNLIIVKNCFNIILLSKQENGQFIIDQSLDFKINNLYGGASDDGQYLITWDVASKLYQVRKLNEIM